jgi:Kdo2-lipid IVA lauroyltransferase/acyltransferase
MMYLTYLLFLIFSFPLRFLPYKVIHRLGAILGLAVFYLYPKYRKRSLSNLALATNLHLTPDEIVKTAKQSLQNLAIVALEYPRLSVETDIHRLATCENPEEASRLMQSGKGVIFFCGHQANWEILFLEGTSRMPGIAIGRPIKNHYLYSLITRLREKFGGTMIPPPKALRASLQALKAGKFVGIVGDQGMPDSGFSCPFLGRRAWTSPLPALLSQRTGCPIIVASTRRVDGKYIIHYSDPIWPQENQMEKVLSTFEATIQERPHEWLWIHNRWKQQLPGTLNKGFRHDAVALIFPDNPTFLSFLPHIRALYPREQITLFIPPHLQCDAPDIEICHELKPDLRFKLVIDCTGSKQLKRYFPSALNIVSFHNPEEFIAHARR